jgi:hypothetical protein
VRERMGGVILRERGALMPGFGAAPGLDVDAAEELFGGPWFGRAWVLCRRFVSRGIGRGRLRLRGSLADSRRR